MEDLNSVTLVARLTRDPEPRGNGNVLALRLAFTASRKVGDSWEDVPQYVDAVVFGRSAEVLATMLAKGDQVAVQGRLAWREWESQDGTKRQAHEIACQRVQMIGKPKAADRPWSSDPTFGAPPPAAAKPAAADDDIPF